MKHDAPLFGWLQERSAGVLLHPTALPGQHGVGTLGPEAHAFVDLLGLCGIHTWQVCPLGPTGYGDSPYSSFSAFALNPYLIHLPELVDLGWLAPEALWPLSGLSEQRVDFGALYERKRPALRAAYDGFVRARRPASTALGDFAEFRKAAASWLEPLGLFLALKDVNGGRPWMEWPEEHRTFEAARKAVTAAVRTEAEAHAFQQWVARAQWDRLRARAVLAGVAIIGDVPLFVAQDSADVWAAPHLFQLDRRTHAPLAVAGCPPDYFTADGQLWGNPLYDWAAHERDGFAWWLDRLAANQALCDIVRLDHFRGFDTYWWIPAGARNARGGHWEPGPGLPFFRKVRDRMPSIRLIAEDLGDLTESVHVLRRATGLPGMAILQFAWGGGADNLYLPHNLERNCVVYPGTHDNDTVRGWYAAAPEQARHHVRSYLRISGEDIAWDLVRAAYASVARLCVIPVQDLLSLGTEARFNTPGSPQGNWQWRMTQPQMAGLRRDAAGYLRSLGTLTGRWHPPKASTPA
jgi:4-alpha-glucanotransferase